MDDHLFKNNKFFIWGETGAIRTFKINTQHTSSSFDIKINAQKKVLFYFYYSDPQNEVTHV